jgi:hypothetical protein
MPQAISRLGPRFRWEKLAFSFYHDQRGVNRSGFFLFDDLRGDFAWARRELRLAGVYGHADPE